MNQDKLLADVQEVFRDILDDETLALTRGTTADDVDDWDSLSHIQIVVAVEKRFGVKFTSREILAWRNVGDLLDCLCGKLG